MTTKDLLEEGINAAFHASLSNTFQIFMSGDEGARDRAKEGIKRALQARTECLAICENF
jgi:hypothetical protein